jgi:5-methylcytosine-specific restriction endonuclease McrA
VGMTLVLNATYEPLAVVPLRRAIVLVLAEKATVVESSGRLVRSERLQVPAPTVVRLSHFVRVPYRHSVPLSRRAVLERDRHRCAYCGQRANSVDHVVPRSRGGGHEWANVVAACSRCNHKKGSHLLAELGWRLPFVPAQPPATIALLVGLSSRQDVWDRDLGPVHVHPHGELAAGGAAGTAAAG